MKLLRNLLAAAIIVAAFAATPAIAQKYTETSIRAASVYEASQTESRALERFARAVEEKSGGAIKIQTYAGTSLGNQKEINEMLMTGGVQIAVHGIAPSERYVGLFLPYAVDGSEHLKRILESEVGQQWNAELAEKTGLEMLRVTFRGTRHTLTSGNVTSVDGLSGLNIRAPDIPALVAAVESYGARPVIMGIGEVYAALATGAIDGLENTLGGLINYKFYEVADHVVLTGHAASPVYWLASSEWFDSLNDESRALIKAELKTATDWADEQNEKLAQEWRAQLEGEGVTFVETDLNQMRANVEAFVATEAVKAWGEDGYAAINAMR